jgi:hypothetical protein
VDARTPILHFLWHDRVNLTGTQSLIDQVELNMLSHISNVASHKYVDPVERWFDIQPLS